MVSIGHRRPVSADRPPRPPAVTEVRSGGRSPGLSLVGLFLNRRAAAGGDLAFEKRSKSIFKARFGEE